MPTMAIGSIPVSWFIPVDSTALGSPVKCRARVSMVGYSYARVGENWRFSQSSRSPERPTASTEVRP